MKPICAILIAIPFLILCNRSQAETIPLAGEWKFQLDPDDRGIKDQWFAHHDFTDTIKLPGTTDEAGKGPLTQGSEPGSLTRVHRYYGPAWYQTQITVPPEWKDKSVDLYLERVIFESRLWLGDAPIDMQDSLDTPHVHHIGIIAPGKYKLTLRITNMEVQPVGVDGHNFTEQTQTIWNGAVGKIELRVRDVEHILQVNAFPDAQAKQLTVHCTVEHPDRCTIHYILREKKAGKSVAQGDEPFEGQTPEPVTTTFDLPLTFEPQLWDEFSPNLYELEVRLDGPTTKDSVKVPVGFRKLSRIGQHIAINGRPIFIRGNMDHSICPLTGYPPTDVDGWRKIFAIYKSYGMNEMRCHSWTPPEAAFEAADEMGIYIQAEIFWLQYPLGSGVPVGKIRVPPNAPANFMDESKSPDDYVRAEMRRVIDTYGNHPSLVFFVIGNELGRSDWPVTAEWIKEEKSYDPRHFYAASTAREITPTDDFSDTHAVPKIGWVRDRLEAFNDWDYEKLYARAPVPIIAHELGQWPTYPRWSEIDKYTGVLRARDLEECEASAKEFNTFSQDQDFHRASGALAIRLYKDEMESHLRTPSCTGFSTLDMQDYPGQGEALVGWLDAFYDSKGSVTPERFRQWCNSTVPLARLAKYSFKTSESITGSAEIAHYGPEDFASATTIWRLLDSSGAVLQSGDFAPAAIKTGTVMKVGDFNIPLAQCKAPGQYRLQLELKSGDLHFTNDWDLCVFPDPVETKTPADILVTNSLDDAKASLAKGQKVLLLAYKLGGKRNKLLANFKPVYWSEWYFPWSETLGALVQNKHPALAQFPTEDHYDWQWADLCKTGHGFVVDRLSPGFRPIVQPVPDFHLNHKYATIFEAVTAGGGKLMVCGYDLENKLSDRPAASQLRQSLLNYMVSADFNPTEKIGDDDLVAIFPQVKDLTAITPPAFKNASVYVTTKPGTGNQIWKRDGDNAVVVDDGFDYTIKCDGIQSVGEFRAWHSTDLHLDLTVTKPNLYDLYIHFVDADRKGRQGTIRFAGHSFALPADTAKGAWLKLDVIREDCLEKHLVIDAHADSGPDLDVDAFALVPKG
jgi:beta-galactosidase